MSIIAAHPDFDLVPKFHDVLEKREKEKKKPSALLLKAFRKEPRTALRQRATPIVP
ncbi:MAG TPA: hypothetical protein VFN49_11315 [Candidatus Aquilonibacter sp.]|nr:hypothetical protein [Candidatus Aquilonibacter sp.]